ncbi:unnamed protein product (macronuclear) [Paramecium tetraurelia]|uniref:Uncharacterized protein n=1 Tax=Paramecium tetraurelia TaxID=5888 RepID=A0CC37_PARTE|nr:uncharacterized protein GSPATT00037138001 [Paramecium tetraurelia]CAK68354.1 unnamed protein product [Paramecium tetraurelia]|eukprot:XP_001435751.1 hypothetical protein (macronuclear) [Paramecium tetraurelia strain d4-2]
MQRKEFQFVEEMVMELFSLIDKSSNQRLKNSLQEPIQSIQQSLQILKEYEEEQQIFNFLKVQFEKLLQIAKTDNHLQIVLGNQKQWFSFFNKKLIAEDRFIESICYISKMMLNQCNTYSVTYTQYLTQECISLNTNQLITIQFNFDDSHTCITFMAPKIIETNLFLVDIELQKLMQKIPHLEQRLNYAEKNQHLLKLCFDQSNKTIKFWSNNDILSYQLTCRKSKQQVDDINYKIYLDVGMVIKLSQNHSLIIEELNFEDKQPDDIQDEIYPIYLQKESENQSQIKINDGNQAVLLSLPLNSSIKLKNKLEMPKEVDMTLFHDNKGYFLEIESQKLDYLPQLLSTRTQDRQLQLKSRNLNFALGLIILGQTNILMKIDLQTIWNGEGLFEI